MSGPSNDNFRDRGLCSRTASCLFERARKINLSENNSISVRLSVLEIYNETLTDLLRSSSSSSSSSMLSSSIINNQTHTQTHIQSQSHTQQHTNTTQQHGIKLSIADTPNGIIIPGLCLLPLSSEEEAFNLLFEAYSNRVVAEHQLNRRSSRSHVIYTYYVTRTKIFKDSNNNNNNSSNIDLDPEIINSKIHLIDLAGSERVEKTGSTGNLP